LGITLAGEMTLHISDFTRVKAKMARIALGALVAAVLGLPLGAAADSWNISGAADSISFYIWSFSGSLSGVALPTTNRGIGIQATNPRSSAVGELKTSPLPRGVMYYSANGAFTLADEDMVDATMQMSRDYTYVFANVAPMQAFRSKPYARRFQLTVQPYLKCSTGNAWGPQNSANGITSGTSSSVSGCPGNTGIAQQGVGYYVYTLYP
jgi:hypothetical protein